VLAGTLDSVAGASAVVRLDDGTLIATRAPGDSVAIGAKVLACVRPENMRLADDAAGSLGGVVELGMPLGATIVHEIRTAGGLRLKLTEPRAPGTRARETGTPVRVRPVSPASVTVFAAP
jgi:putative spermidine/putrescine transport system ATP-binding protein